MESQPQNPEFKNNPENIHSAVLAFLNALGLVFQLLHFPRLRHYFSTGLHQQFFYDLVCSVFNLINCASVQNLLLCPPLKTARIDIFFINNMQPNQ